MTQYVCMHTSVHLTSNSLIKYIVLYGGIAPSWVQTESRESSRKKLDAKVFPRTCPSDLLLPSRLYLLKFSEPPKVVPFTGDVPFVDHFILKLAFSEEKIWGIGIHVCLTKTPLEHITEHVYPDVLYILVILELRRLRQEDFEFNTSLGCIVSSRAAWKT